MIKLYLIITVATIFLTIKSFGQGKDKLISSLFTKWNRVTLASIKMQSKKAIYAEWRSGFEERLPIVTYILNSNSEIRDGIEGKGEPLRYKFLKKIVNDLHLRKQVFIIETVISGEIALSRNFVVEDNQDVTQVKIYTYFHDDWKLVHDTIIPKKFNLHALFSNNHSITSLDGVNESDLTLTEFNSSKILSKYFIAVTIPENSDIIKITKPQ